MKLKSLLSPRALLGPAGGLVYHWRALRYQKKLWRPFRDQVAIWLRDWALDCQLLVLIGPSAGYTLPREFVLRFQRIVVVEPDPAAFLLFQSRFLVPVDWQREDFFDLSSSKPNPDKLLELFSRYPAGAFLFCNVLGQLPVLLREKRAAIESEPRKMKKGKSASIKPRQDITAEVEAYMQRLAEVLRLARQHRPDLKMASYHDRFSRELSRPNEVIDHLTGVLFEKESHRKEFPWRLTPQIEHQVEFWCC